MPDYELTRGTFRLPDGTVAEQGETITIPADVRAAYHPEKFERKDGQGIPVVSDDEEEEASEDDTVEASTDLPSEWEDLRAMAVAVETDEVNGKSSKDEIEAFFDDFEPSEISQVKQTADIGAGE